MKKNLILLFSILPLLSYAQQREWFDVTSEYIVNPDFSDNNSKGWTVNSNAWSTKCEYGTQEFWNGTWDIRQTLKLPNGHYRVSVNAFHRVGENNTQAVSNYKNKTEKITSYLMLNDARHALKSVYSQSLAENYGWNCWSPNNSVWYPNGTNSASYCFSRNMYINEAEVDVTNGSLLIGITNASSVGNNWCIMDNWKLERLEELDNSQEAMSHLVINEIQTSNVDQFVDPSFNYGAWMEIYNPNESAIDIKGCYISDDASVPAKSKIAYSIVIPSKGYACVWFGHHDRYCRTQIPFKPDAEGGYLSIATPDGKVIDSKEYPQIPSRVSYARIVDGGADFGFTSSPSPGSSNAGSEFCSVRLDAPVVSDDGGLFTDAKSFSVDIPSGASLMFTTDGSTPTAQHGTKSADGKFWCNKTTTYRFCLVAKGKLTSPVVTRSFILDSRSHTLPVVSVVSDDANLYSNELGVFTRGVNGRPGNGQSSPCNWNMDWERPVNFEYFDKEHNLQANQEAHLERCGGWSRAWTPFSFKIKANKVYEGQNYIPYQFFPAKPYLKHKALQLRNGGNDTGCRIKDVALQQIIGRSGLMVEYQEYQPVQHYINGKYAGVINVREPNNQHYAYSNYGLDDEVIDQFEMSPDSGYVQKCGTKDVFSKIVSLSKQCDISDAAYESLCGMLDIDSYCNYMAVQLFLGGTDWPQNNVKGFRERKDGAKFRFVLFDLDFAFNTSKPFDTFASKQRYTFDRLYGIDPDGNNYTGKQITAEIEFVTLFLNLIKNSKFRTKFITTYCLVAGSVFESTRCTQIINELVNAVRGAQKLKSEVYSTSSNDGTSPEGTANDMKTKFTTGNWQQNLVTALKNYSPLKLLSTGNNKITLSANANAELFVNDVKVPTGKFSGTLFLPTVLKAVAPAGYRFDCWTNNGKEVSTESEYKITAKGGSYNISAKFVKLTDEEKEQAGMPTAPVVINEVSASNSIYINEYGKKDDWVELYNTTDNDIDLEGAYLSDNPSKPKKHKITSAGTLASTIIPAHGYKIIWCGKRDTDRELHASFKLGNEAGSSVSILAADNSWSDTMEYGVMEGDETYARYPDASGNVYHTTTPSILAANRIGSYATLESAVSSTGVGNVAVGTVLSLSMDEEGLSVTYDKTADAVLTIYTPDGVLAMSKTIRLFDGKQMINIGMLAPGNYIVKVKVGKEQSTVKFNLKLKVKS